MRPKDMHYHTGMGAVWATAPMVANKALDLVDTKSMRLANNIPSDSPELLPFF